MKSYTIETVTKLMTPQNAKQLLATQFNNRPISQHAVDQIAKMIVDGDWVLNHQSIAVVSFVNLNERLVDGQHRLSAIVKANIPVLIRISIYKDVNQEDFIEIVKLFDRGRKRSISDARKIAGQDGTSKEVGVAKQLLMRYNVANDNSISQMDIDRALDKYYPYIHHVVSKLGKKRAIGSTQVMGIICKAIISKPEHSARINKFIDFLASGGQTENPATDNAVNVILSALVYGSLKPDNYQRVELTQKVQSALVHFINKQPVKKLYALREDVFSIH